MEYLEYFQTVQESSSRWRCCCYGRCYLCYLTQLNWKYVPLSIIDRCGGFLVPVGLRAFLQEVQKILRIFPEKLKSLILIPILHLYYLDWKFVFGVVFLSILISNCIIIVHTKWCGRLPNIILIAYEKMIIAQN